MTKKQELEILDKTIAMLGRDSYIGPWLADVRGEVERDIRSDIAPCPTVAQSRSIFGREVLALNEKAAKIIADASAKADKIVAAASEEAGRIRRRVASELARCAATLDGRI